MVQNRQEDSLGANSVNPGHLRGQPLKGAWHPLLAGARLLQGLHPVGHLVAQSRDL